MKVDWLEIPSGSFLMGLSKNQVEMLQSKLSIRLSFHDRVDLSTELSLREIILDDFWIARTPITYRQMNEFIASGHPYADPWKTRNLSSFPEYLLDHPEAVLWQQANAFSAWLNARLPTAFEWEKAARGTDGRLYPWGNQWDDSRGNFGQEDRRGAAIGTFSSAVGIYPEGASPYGMCDVVGNIREWTSTFEYDPRTKLEVPVVKGTCAREDDNPPWLVHRATRHRSGSLIPIDAPPYTGFRPVLDRWQRQIWQGIDLQRA